MTILVNAPCTTCDGTRRDYYATDEGVRWCPCAACGGVGSQMRVVRV